MFGDLAVLLGEPMWDMLLELFVAHYEGAPILPSSLSAMSSISPATVIRWVAVLAAHGLVERATDASDRSERSIQLTNDGLLLVTRAVSA